MLQQVLFELQNEITEELATEVIYNDIVEGNGEVSWDSISGLGHVKSHLQVICC